MKKIFVTTLLIIGCVSVFAQNSMSGERQRARNFMQAGDLDNAVLVLAKAIEANKSDVGLQKDLALAYYYQKNYAKALETIHPVIASPDCDPAAYQLAGNIYKAQENYKEAERNYKDGLKDFPNSGPLYNDYGELLEIMKNPTGAIQHWEKGIQLAPSYGGNYYNAAVYYYKQQDDKVWAIIYGEIYANMESLNPKANNIKKMVLDAYKTKLFISNNLKADAENQKNAFAKAVIETFAKQSGISAQGITPESLAMIRTRFILDWNTSFAKTYPFRLFEYHQQLMKDGLFDSYNQWMFGPVSDQPEFEKWVAAHKAEYDKFTDFHKSRVFKMPKGQTYSLK
ncbi:tetratricopeptide repeat protein [Niabella insulamsoli]|uniref:tetratricopeptide repeat protein n=1 Tax=Niabella insulamsoli TaxID=3144874 RepID=UPI0031FDFE6F